MGWGLHKLLCNLTSLKISSDGEIAHGLAACGSAELVLGRQLVFPKLCQVPASSGAHPDLGGVEKVNGEKSS